MSQKDLVIVSHSQNEAITKCILDNKNFFEEKIVIISLQELIFDYEIFDETSDAGTCIKWIKESGYISSRDYYLLNRVLYVPEKLFLDFTKADREYARREFEAYIGFAFNAFCGIGNHFPNGACSESSSLPQQWNKVYKEFGINVPEYYWVWLIIITSIIKTASYTQEYTIFLIGR